VLIRIAGFFFVLLGLMSLLGKGFSSFLKVDKLKASSKNDKIGVFVFGIAFALGWSVCLGPILAGILLMAGILKNFLYAGLLLFSYSLGIFVPLFILASLTDRYNLAEKPFFRKGIKLGRFRTNAANLIAGLLFIFLGIIFILFGGTSFLIALNPFGSLSFFYELQQKLIGMRFLNLIGLIILVLLIIFLIKVMRKK
jgi:cytochrome c biogenesis protein CcdA